MNIELKKIHYAAFASEETNCFSADVWIDGKRAGEARNDGHGGATYITPREMEARLNAYAATLPPVVSAEFNDPFDKSKPFIYQPTAENVIDDLLAEWLTKRDFARLLQKHILYTVVGKRGVYRTKGAKNGAQLNAWLRDPRLSEKLKADKILNAMPQADALATFRAEA